MFTAFLRIVAAAVALLAAQMIAGMLVPITVSGPPDILMWLFVSDVVIAAALGWAALRSDWRGAKLGAVLFAIPFAIATVNAIEGAFFLTSVNFDWQRLILNTAVTYAIAAVLWSVLFSARRRPTDTDVTFSSYSVLGKAWRFAVCAVAYLVLYFTAGAIIFPYVREFYATQTIPSLGKIIAMQLLLRGPVFVVICLLLVRMFRMTRWAGALSVGLAFTLLSGVAPLIVPNPFFPDTVRWVHLGEVTGSNFVFGVIVGWLYGGTVKATAGKMAPVEPTPSEPQLVTR